MKSENASQTPPRLSGSYPLAGHLIEFNKDRQDLFRRGLKEEGRVFTIKLGPQNAAVLVGPEFHRQFFMETDKSLDMSKPYFFLKPILGEVMFVAGHNEYLNQRPVIYEPFRGNKMVRYIEVMQNVVQRWLNGLGEEGRMEITTECMNLVQQVAGEAFMGREFMEKAGEEFWSNYADLGKALDPVLPSWLPLPKFIRRDRAKKRMEKILQPIIRERRENPEKYDDFLQDFLNKPFKDGSMASDEDIINLLIAFMFASHETTGGQAAWTIIQLLHHPGYLKKVQEELHSELTYRAPVDASALSRLSHVRWAVDETTRMKPSADMVLRVAKSDFTVGDYTIPKGWLVILAIETAQQLPDHFTNPQQYDPERYSPERKEHKENPYAIAGFGGGVHKCAGMNFANNEMMVIASLLLQQFDLELETQDTGIDRTLGANRPTATWIRYKRKKTEELLTDDVIRQAREAGCPHLSKMQSSSKETVIETA